MIEDLNQTKFAAQEPLSQKPEMVVGQTPKEMSAESMEPLLKKPNKFKLVMIIFGGLMVLLITLIAILALSRRSGGGALTSSPTPVDQTQPISLTQLEQRVEDLDQSLTEADPTRQELVFPPVNLTLRLDPAAN